VTAYVAMGAALEVQCRNRPVLTSRIMLPQGDDASISCLEDPFSDGKIAICRLQECRDSSVD